MFQRSRFRIYPALFAFSNIKNVQNIRKIRISKQTQRTFDSRLFTGTVLFGLFWPLGSKKEKEVEPAATKDVGIEEGIRIADQLFDNGQFEECYSCLKTLQSRTKANVDIMWRTSRALYQMASRPETDKGKRKELAFEAFDVITEAMKLDEANFAVHKWMSVVLDLKSSCQGTKERVKNLETVKNHMMRAVEINPKDATTLYMLGEWCYRIADMPWYQRKIAQTIFATPPTSSYEEALSYFNRAELVEPNFYSMNLLMLGKSYLKLGNTDAAKHYLLIALAYPARTNDDHQANKEARELLKGLT